MTKKHTMKEILWKDVKKGMCIVTHAKNYDASEYFFIKKKPKEKRDWIAFADCPHKDVMTIDKTLYKGNALKTNPDTVVIMLEGAPGTISCQEWYKIYDSRERLRSERLKNDKL